MDYLPLVTLTSLVTVKALFNHGKTTSVVGLFVDLILVSNPVVREEALRLDVSLVAALGLATSYEELALLTLT